MKIMNKKVLIASLLIITTVIATFAALNLGKYAQADPGPTELAIEPPSVTVPSFTNFVVEVWIRLPEMPVDGFDVLIHYDPTVVSLVSVTPGPDVPPTDIFEVDPAPPADLVHFWDFSVNGDTIPPLAYALIAKIVFHCIGVGSTPLTIDIGATVLWDPSWIPIPYTPYDGWVNQIAYWEPLKLQHIVEWPGIFRYWDIPFPWPLATAAGYMEIKAELEAKGYMFDPAINPETATAMAVEGSHEEETFSGTVTSLWSHNTLDDGTRACLLSAEMHDGTSMAMAFATNLLPPEQVPDVDPYIIVNAMPYMYLRFYWYAWPSDIYPLGRIITWPYWWYDSHSHPNWFWGPYWWWRSYIKGYFLAMPWPPLDINWAYWRPYWGWWWHWIYWRHWYWWSTYFPYDP